MPPKKGSKTLQNRRQRSFADRRKQKPPKLIPISETRQSLCNAHPPIRPPFPFHTIQRHSMSLYFSRAVARQPQLLLRRTAFRTQSTTSEAATKAKEAASQVQSKATEGLSRVQSSAGNAMSRIGSAAGSAMNTLSGIGGPIGRLVNFVQCKFFFTTLAV